MSWSTATTFFEQPVKNEIKTYENIGKIDAGKGVGYKTGLVAFVIILDYPWLLRKIKR